MNSSLVLHLRRLIAGEYDRITEPPPLRSLASLESQAYRLLARIDAGLHVPGRLIAAGLGYELLPRRPPGTCGEASHHRVVAYDPTLPDAEQSVLCAHGVAHLVLERDAEPSGHSDAWLLGCLLLVPRVAVQTMTAAELVRASHAPAWLVEGMRALLLRWDSDGESVSCKRYSESA